MSNWNSSVPLPTSDSDSSTMVGEDEVFSDIDSADEEEKIAEEKIEDDIQEEKYEETGVKCQTDEVTCAICYTALYVGNSVTTRCNHNYCKKCFFRWIEVNATCPQCRAPIDSNTNLTDEQISKEMSELYETYQHYLIENQRLYREQHRLCTDILGEKDKMYKLKMTTNSLLRRQIRLREQIDITLGYNQGQLAAIHNIKNEHTKEEFTNRMFETMKNNPAFMNGFYKAIHREEKLLKSFKKNVLTRLDEENMKIHHSSCHRNISFIVDDEQED